MDTQEPVTATAQLDRLLEGMNLIVVCGRSDDATEWMNAFGVDRCLAVGLDEVVLVTRKQLRPNESGRLAIHHELLASLDSSGWLASLANTFDPHKQATVIIPDPLDPPNAGSRRRLGRRRRMWQLCEDKTVVDAIWDCLGLTRPSSVIADGGYESSSVAGLIDSPHGVMCSVQPRGAAPTSGAEGMWWSRNGSPRFDAGMEHRLRFMPLIPGMPVRLHGMVFADATVVFPPMEIVALPRPETATLLCCGAASVLPGSASLQALTERIGVGLSSILEYRGAFSVDGILSADGFLPTDLNTRLSSAIEVAFPAVRVQIQAANVLAREDVALHSPNWISSILDLAFDNRTITVYGACSRRGSGISEPIAVCWDGHELIEASTGRTPDGWIEVAASLRGWTLTARLTRERLPYGQYAGPHAPEIFRFADSFLGTNFGVLEVPFGAEALSGKRSERASDLAMNHGLTRSERPPSACG